MERIILCFFCFIPGLLMAQKAIDHTGQIDTTGKRDIIDVGKTLLHISPTPLDTTKKKAVYFSLLPVSYSVPGGGTALFTSTVFGFYSGDHKTNYISTVTFAPYFNFHSRFGL